MFPVGPTAGGGGGGGFPGVLGPRAPEKSLPAATEAAPCKPADATPSSNLLEVAGVYEPIGLPYMSIAGLPYGSIAGLLYESTFGLLNIDGLNASAELAMNAMRRSCATVWNGRIFIICGETWLVCNKKFKKSRETLAVKTKRRFEIWKE